MGVGSFASNARRIQLSHDSVQKIACNQIWRSTYICSACHSEVRDVDILTA
jgi:hypothetical protein